MNKFLRGCVGELPIAIIAVILVAMLGSIADKNTALTEAAMLRSKLLRIQIAERDAIICCEFHHPSGGIKENGQ